MRGAPATGAAALAIALILIGGVSALAYPDGVVPEWFIVWGGPTWDSADGLATDGQYIYVVSDYSGFSPSGRIVNDGYIAKLRPNGKVVWNLTWGKSGFDEFRAIAYSGGYLYAAGYYEPTGRFPGDPVVVKFTPDGEEVWRRTWKGNTDEVFYAITAHGGYIYAVGDTEHPKKVGGGFQWQMDILIVKYDTDGNVVWGKRLDFEGFDIARDVWGLGNWIYVVGATEAGAGMGDVLLMKIDPADGSVMWTKTWGEEACDELGLKMAISGGYIYISGVKGCDATTSGVLLKYDLDGNLIWERTWEGRGFAQFNGMVVEGDSIYLVGSTGVVTGGEIQQYDFVLVKYDTSGNQVWVKTIARKGALSGKTGYLWTLIKVGNYMYASGHIYKYRADDPMDAVVMKFLAETAEEAPGEGGAVVEDILAVEAPEKALVNRYLKLNVTVTNPLDSRAEYTLVLSSDPGGVLTTKDVTLGPGETRAVQLMVVPVVEGPLSLTGTLKRGGVELTSDSVTVEIVSSLEEVQETPSPTPPSTQETPSPTTPSPTTTAPPGTEAPEVPEEEEGVPILAIAVGVAVAAGALAGAFLVMRRGAPLAAKPAVEAPKPPAPEPEEVLRLREKLRSLERAREEGRISEETYAELKAKYERELKDLLGGSS